MAKPFPHVYSVTTSVSPHDQFVPLGGEMLPTLKTVVPAEFDGPGGEWSPEALLVASVLDCFAITFRGISRASKFSWLSLSCEAQGILERVDHVTQFTGFVIHAHLRLPDGADEALARRILAKADSTCLIANSLKADVRLDIEIEVEHPEIVHSH